MNNSSIWFAAVLPVVNWVRWVLPGDTAWERGSVVTPSIGMNTHKVTDKKDRSQRNSDKNTVGGEPTARRRNLLNLITQPTRYEILQNIFGHPKQLPALKEIDYLMPDTSKSTIRNHLDRLIEEGMVAKVELPEEEQTRDNPRKFYGLTQECYDLLDQAGLLRAEEALQETVLQTELTPDVEQYLDAPRPDWGPASVLDEYSSE